MFRLGQFTPQLKLLFHTAYIQRWLKGENVYPILVEFDLSNACNHKCNFCNFSYLTDKSVLDKDVACKTIAVLAKNGVKAINWTGGGEPLINTEFGDIFSWTTRRGIEQGLFTNGALIREDDIEGLLATQTWIRFSIDASTKETYAKIRGVDEFNKVVSIVKRMVEVRNEYEYNTQIGIGFVITPDNYREIGRFADLIEETGVDYGQYKPRIGNELELSEAMWWECNVKPLLEEVFKSSTKAVINLYKFNDLSENQFDKPYPICYGHVFCPCIGADGKVWVCSQLRGYGKYCMGNIYKESFDSIWKGQWRRDAIARIDVNKCPPCCKNNEINKILYHIKHPARNTHYNFL